MQTKKLLLCGPRKVIIGDLQYIWKHFQELPLIHTTHTLNETHRHILWVANKSCLVSKSVNRHTCSLLVVERADSIFVKFMLDKNYIHFLKSKLIFSCFIQHT